MFRINRYFVSHKLSRVSLAAVFLLTASAVQSSFGDDHQHAEHIHFDIRSVASGDWSKPATWQPARVPADGERVLISRGTDVRYDVESTAVIRLIQVVGALRFARDRDTELNVGLMKVQNSDKCSESGFACDFAEINAAGEPNVSVRRSVPTLEVGTLENPIPRPHVARIRLHYVDGMDKQDAPALVCCSAQMELHGAPLRRTWLKLSENVVAGATHVVVEQDVHDWCVGDEVIVTGSEHQYNGGSFRHDEDSVTTERRTIVEIDGTTIRLNTALKYPHFGEGKYRSEVANLSRNVVIESADPAGVRGHTLYHAFSAGGISYARFSHLGKEGVLGRYAIHYHLVGDTMRGSQVLGAAIVDSHNRWITIHGTQYLVVRDCVGYQSVGHGYFMEDGTEVHNLLDHNLGVQAYKGRRLPKQVLPFDPNDGAAFWWANGRNTIVRNVACENDQYGYRYDSQQRSNFDSNLPVLMPDGETREIDIRTIAISRFEANESHTEGLYSFAFAGTEGVGPDTKHPHQLKGLVAWQTHYALRAQLPTMSIEDIDINHAAYGIYRPWFENHVYRDIRIAATGTEPFNRGLDDRSLQHGRITVDGLTFSDLGYGGQMPLIQISANNVSGDAESHFRNVKVLGRQRDDRWPLVNLGGGPRLRPTTPKGVPIYLHDYFGEGKHAKVVSTRAKDLLADGNRYESRPPTTGNESVVAVVTGIEWPSLHDPIDDLPPATIVTSVRPKDGGLEVHGVSHDNGAITAVKVNGLPAAITSVEAGVADWSIVLPIPSDEKLNAAATDAAGNTEIDSHRLTVPDVLRASSAK